MWIIDTSVALPGHDRFRDTGILNHTKWCYYKMYNILVYSTNQIWHKFDIKSTTNILDMLNIQLQNWTLNLKEQFLPKFMVIIINIKYTLKSWHYGWNKTKERLNS